jgi:hypothetical protein
MGHLNNFTRPVLDPLSDLHLQLLTICALYRNAQDRLRWQATTLMEGQDGQQFSGMTASAFYEAVTRYCQTSEQLVQQIETFALNTQSCYDDITSAGNATEQQVGGHEDMLVRLLSGIQLGDVLSTGESVIQVAMNVLKFSLQNVWENDLLILKLELDILEFLGPLLVQWGAAIWHAIQAFLRLVEQFLSEVKRAARELVEETAHLLKVSEKIMESPFVKTLIEDIAEKLGKGEMLERILKMTKSIPLLDILTYIPNTLIDISEHPLTPRDVMAAILGNAVQVGVSLIPDVGEVVAIVSVADAGVVIVAQGQADVLKFEADHAPSLFRQYLLDESNYYQSVAHNADTFGEVYHDIGLILVDNITRQASPPITTPDTLFDQGDYQLATDSAKLDSDLFISAFGIGEFLAGNNGWLLYEVIHESGL